MMLLPAAHSWSIHREIWDHCRCDNGYCSCDPDPELRAIVNGPSDPDVYDIMADVEYFAYICVLTVIFFGPCLVVTVFLLYKLWKSYGTVKL